MYENVSAGALTAELGIDSQAIQQGGLNLPAQTDTGLDAPQQHAITKLRAIHSLSFDAAREKLSALRLKRREGQNSLNPGQVIAEVKDAPIKAKAAIAGL